MKYAEILDSLRSKSTLLENNIKHLESKKAEIDEDILSLNDALEDLNAAICSIRNLMGVSLAEPGKYE